MRRVAFHAITILFAVLCYLGVRDVWYGYRDARTLLQFVDLAGKAIYALCAAGIVVQRLVRQRGRLLMWLWSAALVWASGLAPLAWDGAGWGPSLTAAAASLAIAVLILLVDAWVNTRPLLSGQGL